MSLYPQIKDPVPPAYAPGYQQGYQQAHQTAPNPPIHANVPPIVHTVNNTTVNVGPQNVQQPNFQNQPHYQQPVIFQAPPAPVHRFYGCCDAKIGWTMIYGTVLAMKIISLVVSADDYFNDAFRIDEKPATYIGSDNMNQKISGALIETIILTLALILLFIGMFKNISVCLWPIVIYNGLTTVLLSIQFVGCMLYVVGAQNFGIVILKGVNYVNDVPFMPEPWDVEDEVNWDGEHVIGAASWLGMLFCGIGFMVGTVVYAVLTKGLNDYRKWMATV